MGARARPESVRRVLLLLVRVDRLHHAFELLLCKHRYHLDSCGARIRRALERQGVVDDEASVVRPGGRGRHDVLVGRGLLVRGGAFRGRLSDPRHHPALEREGMEALPQSAREDSQRPERNRLLRVGLCERGRRVREGHELLLRRRRDRDVRCASARRDMGRTFMVYLDIGPAQRQRQCQPRRGAMHECHPLRHDRDRGERFPTSLRSPTARCGTEKRGRSSPCPSRPRRTIIRTPRS